MARLQGDVERHGERLEIAAHRRPVVCRLIGGAIALHEAVDADAAPQHLVDTGRDDLPAVEVSAQSAGGVYEARHEVVDVAALSSHRRSIRGLGLERGCDETARRSSRSA